MLFFKLLKVFHLFGQWLLTAFTHQSSYMCQGELLQLFLSPFWGHHAITFTVFHLQQFKYSQFEIFNIVKHSGRFRHLHTLPKSFHLLFTFSCSFIGRNQKTRLTASLGFCLPPLELRLLHFPLGVLERVFRVQVYFFRSAATCGGHHRFPLQIGWEGLFGFSKSLLTHHLRTTSWLAV